MTVSFHEESYSASSIDAEFYDSDDFRMYCFKVLPCSKRYSHDWTTCPFAHPGEKARRRDPRMCQYTAIACPEMKKDMVCPRGKHCPYSHNDFEYWLHPSRYRTQLCNDGVSCRRKVCFFAHQALELRVPAYKPVLPDIEQDLCTQEFSIPSIMNMERMSAELPHLDSVLSSSSSFTENVSWPFSASTPSNDPIINSNLTGPLSETLSVEQLSSGLADRTVSPGLDQVVQSLATLQLAPQQAEGQTAALLNGQSSAASAILLQQLSSQPMQQVGYWPNAPARHHRVSLSSNSGVPVTIPEDGPLSKPEYGNPDLAYQSSLYSPTPHGMQSNRMDPAAQAAQILMQTASSNQRRHSLDSATRLLSSQLLPQHGQQHFGNRRSFDVHQFGRPPVLHQAMTALSEARLIDNQLPYHFPQSTEERPNAMLMGGEYLGFREHQQSSQMEQFQMLLQASTGAMMHDRQSPAQLHQPKPATNVDVYQLLSCIQQQHQQ